MNNLTEEIDDILGLVPESRHESRCHKALKRAWDEIERLTPVEHPGMLDPYFKMTPEQQTHWEQVKKGREEGLRMLNEQRQEIERLQKNYNDLLFQVEEKIPDETRHETAKRLIRNAQRQDNPPQKQSGHE